MKETWKENFGFKTNRKMTNVGYILMQKLQCCIRRVF